MKNKFKIASLILFSPIICTPILFINNNTNISMITNNTTYNSDNSFLKGVRSLGISESKYKNALVTADGDVSQGVVEEAIENTFINNINSIYGNINDELNPDLSNAFSFENRRIENDINGHFIVADVVPIDKKLFNPSDDETLEKLIIRDFKFYGFNKPIPTNPESVDTLLPINDLFPFEIIDKYKNYLRINFNHKPNGMVAIPTFMPENYNGTLKINNIEVDKYYPTDSYHVVNDKKNFSTNLVINGFKHAVPTNISGQTFTYTGDFNLKKDINNYLVKNNMVPTNYDFNNVTVNTNLDNRTCTITFNGYFDSSTNWNSGVSNPQVINLSLNNTSISGVINGSNFLGGYSSPYQIKQLFEKKDTNVLTNLKRTIIENIQNPASSYIDMNNVEINNVIDKNIENNAYIMIDFTLKNTATEDGQILPTWSRNVKINKLNYKKTTYTLKNINLSNYGADYITNENFKNFIDINNPLFDTNYTVNDSITGADYNNGIENIFIESNKYVDGNGDVVNGTKSDKVEINGFAKVQNTILKYESSTPFSIAVSIEQINSYFKVQNLASYKNILFKDGEKIPTISNIKIISKDNIGNVIIQYDATNFLENNRFVNKNGVQEELHFLKTIDGFGIKKSDEKLTNENVYDYIEIQPLLWPYFNLSETSTPNEIKDALSKKGYSIIVVDGKAQLIFNNNSLGTIKKTIEVSKDSSDDNTLNILIIVLLVVGTLGVIFLVLFFILYFLIPKKFKKKKKENTEQILNSENDNNANEREINDQ